MLVQLNKDLCSNLKANALESGQNFCPCIDREHSAQCAAQVILTDGSVAMNQTFSYYRSSNSRLLYSLPRYSLASDIFEILLPIRRQVGGSFVPILAMRFAFRSAVSLNRSDWYL